MNIRPLGALILSTVLFSGCATLQKGAAYYQSEWAKGETPFQLAAHNPANAGPRFDQSAWASRGYQSVGGVVVNSETTLAQAAAFNAGR